MGKIKPVSKLSAGADCECDHKFDFRYYTLTGECDFALFLVDHLPPQWLQGLLRGKFGFL